MRKEDQHVDLRMFRRVPGSKRWLLAVLAAAAATAAPATANLAPPAPNSKFPGRTAPQRTPGRYRHRQPIQTWRLPSRRARGSALDARIRSQTGGG